LSLGKGTLQVVRTGFGDHSGSYLMGSGGSSLGVKLPGREADHSSPSSAEVKNTTIRRIRLHGVVLN
jgi:hypothetical protein